MIENKAGVRRDAGAMPDCAVKSAGKNSVVLETRNTELEQIFTCGQCFRWKRIGNVWQGTAGGRFLTAEQRGNEIILTGAGKAEFDAFWRVYFDFDTDYTGIKNELSGIDTNLAKAVDFGGGIRLLRQEPFETLISFIISANNNIPRISRCVEALCRAYGAFIGEEPVSGQPVFAFPSPEALAGTTPEEVSELTHAGYRCPYIVNAAKRFIERGGDLSDPESYPGVGPKVAACIKLFTGADTESFPVDVWVRRLIGELYFGNGETDPDAGAVRKFVSEHFTRLGGYAQQYLFYWRRAQG